MNQEQQIQAIEKELGFTREDADNCSCYANPNGPCANCWSLGWRIGGIEPGTPDDPCAECGSNDCNGQCAGDDMMGCSS